MKQTPLTEIYNESILEIIPVDLKKIIEIGTGSGALAKAYKKINGEVYYVGVEICKDYEVLSKKNCDKTYFENFENPSKELEYELYDTDLVIFADVLEHMYNPWSVLKKLSEKLPPNGSVIASIPNIQHWSIQKGILAGEFNYTETGLLDRTHIRFFTKKTIKDLFEKNGFPEVQITPRIFDFPGQNESLKIIREAAISYGTDTQQAIMDAATFQYTVLAKQRK